VGEKMKHLGIDRLGVDERLALVEEIWDSIAADPASVPLPADHKAELDRRLADHAANPNDEPDCPASRGATGRRRRSGMVPAPSQ
jgi:putative addiction module component (TIGR02574 family)